MSAADNLPDYLFRLTQLFGSIGPFGAPHTGIDLSAPVGTPVHAVSGGKVVWAGPGGAPGHPGIINAEGGTAVVVDTGNGQKQVYAHLSSTLVRAGQYIPAGTVIANSGNTGHTTGAHLHFAVWDTAKNKYIDPLTTGLTVNSLRNAVATGPSEGGGSGQTCAWVGVNGSPGICFPTGHVITKEDAGDITKQLSSIYPQMGPLDIIVLRNALENNLVGQKWDGSVYGKLQTIFNATGAAVNVGPEVGEAVKGITDIPGAIGEFGATVGRLVVYVIALVLIIMGIKLYAQGAGQAQAPA